MDSCRPESTRHSQMHCEQNGDARNGTDRSVDAEISHYRGAQQRSIKCECAAVSTRERALEFSERYKNENSSSSKKGVGASNLRWIHQCQLSEITNVAIKVATTSARPRHHWITTIAINFTTAVATVLLFWAMFGKSAGTLSNTPSTNNLPERSIDVNLDYCFCLK